MFGFPLPPSSLQYVLHKYIRNCAGFALAPPVSVTWCIHIRCLLHPLRRSHEEQLMECLEQLTRFRSYTGCERPPEGDFPWWQEREELLAHNTCLSRDCSSLSKELQLVRVRLEALTEMLALQESGLCSGGNSGPPVEGEGEGAQQRLLTRYSTRTPCAGVCQTHIMSDLGICWFLSIRHVIDSFTWQNVSAPKGPSSVAKRVQNKSCKMRSTAE